MPFSIVCASHLCYKLYKKRISLKIKFYETSLGNSIIKVSVLFTSNIYILPLLLFQWLKRLDDHVEYNVNESNIFEVKNQKFLVLKTDDVYPKDGFYVNKLIIKNVQPADVGMYICLATNSMGYSFKSAYLNLKAGMYCMIWQFGTYSSVSIQNCFKLIVICLRGESAVE